MSFAVSTKPSSPFWSQPSNPIPWGSGLLLALLLHGGLLFWLSYQPVLIQPAASFTPMALMLLPSIQPESTAVVEDKPDQVRQKQAVAPPVTAVKTQEDIPVKPTIAPDPEIIVAKKVQPKPKPKVQPQPVKALVETKVEKPTAPASVTSTAMGNPQPNQTAPGANTVNMPTHQQSNWTSLLLQRLERYKRYPAQALRQQAKGVVLINLTVDRAGQVLHVSLARSSGVSSLDKEALALPERASPLPALPDDMAEGKSQINITLPIRFDLRQ